MNTPPFDPNTLTDAAKRFLIELYLWWRGWTAKDLIDAMRRESEGAQIDALEA